MKKTEIKTEELWGEDLYNVFAHYINEEGWLTAEWADIIEKEVPRWDKNYNDNPEYKNTYSRMYNTEFEDNEKGDMIRPFA